MADPTVTGHVRLDVSDLIERLRFAQAATRRQIGRLVRDANARLQGLRANGVAQSLTRVAGIIGGIGSKMAGQFAMAGAAVGALVPLVAGLVATLANILPASALAVSGVLAIGLAAGTLKIAMSGVGDAVKAALDPSDPEAYAEALKQLSPNARSFVEQIRQARPALDAIKKTVQDKVFAGLDKQLGSTAKVALPAFKSALSSTATTLNQMGKGVFAAARRLAKEGTLGTALKGATSGLREFSHVPGQVVTALGQIGAAAAPAFARLSKAGGSALDRLAAKLTKSFESGGMERAIEQAITLIGQLGRVLGNVGSVVGSVFGAAQTSGGGFLGVLQSVTAEIARIAKTDAVQNGLRALFGVMSTLGKTVAPLLGQALQVIAQVFTELGPPAQQLVRVLGDALGKILKALGPVLVQLADSFGKLVIALLPIITLFGDLIADFLPVLTPLFKSLGDVFVELTPLIAQLAQNIGAQLQPLLQALPGILNTLLPPFVELVGAVLPPLVTILALLTPGLAALSRGFAELFVALAPILAEVLNLGVALAQELAPAILPLLLPAIKLFTTAMKAFAFTVTDFVAPALRVVIMALKGDFKGAADLALATARNLDAKVSEAFGSLVQRVKLRLSEYVIALQQKVKDGALQFTQGINRMASDAEAKVRGLPGRIRGALGNLSLLLYTAGSNIIQGLVDGIQSKIGSVRSKLSELTNLIPSWKGPPRRDAKLLTPAGKSIIKGLVDGIDASTASLKSKLNSITNTIERAININSGNRRKVGGLGGLLAGVERDNKKLLSLAKQRDAVASKLKSAQKKLDDAIKARSKAATDFRDGILGDANITAGNGVVNSVSAITIGLQQAVKKTQEFAANIAKLKKAGLRSDLLGDIAAAGVDGGAATAEALARATPAELKRINDLQAQLSKAASSTGSSVAGALYDSGVKAAQGLVAGLKKQQGAIEKQMEKIAAAMVKAMKKALKIKSPSRVFMGIGQMSGDGLREGMLRSRQAVAAASASMAAAAVGAADVAGRAMQTIPAPGQLTAAYAGTAGAPTTNNTFNLYQSDATPDGILRALSWQGLIGRKG
ncbi:hypothetical protein OG195_27245 [Streptomyces sp. NBC_01362]|uniref:hypothetical protein n=1 Tax=Streptomyces sp. NBC_01362 TaxID=2903839 RepID=UPI002E31B0AD|nr:hypothetical protein [Streptomyces sp. NBC_01362]